MRDLGAPRGKLPFKELSWPGPLAAAEPGWWPRAGDVGPCGMARERGASSRTAMAQVTAEGMLQTGMKTSSALHMENRKFIFLSTTSQLFLASFFAFCYMQMLEKINQFSKDQSAPAPVLTGARFRRCTPAFVNSSSPQMENHPVAGNPQRSPYFSKCKDCFT